MKYIFLLLFSLPFAWDQITPTFQLHSEAHLWTDRANNPIQWNKKSSQGRLERAPYFLHHASLGIKAEHKQHKLSLSLPYQQFQPQKYSQVEAAPYAFEYRLQLAVDSNPKSQSFWGPLHLNWSYQKTKQHSFGIQAWLPLQYPRTIEYASKSQYFLPGYRIGFSLRSDSKYGLFQQNLQSQIFQDQSRISQFFDFESSWSLSYGKHLFYTPLSLQYTYLQRQLNPILGNVEEHHFASKAKVSWQSGGRFNLGVQVYSTLFSMTYGVFDLGPNEWIDSDRVIGFQIGSL